MLGGANITFHQHLFRDRFYDSAVGTVTIASFTNDFINGKVTQVGP